MREEADTHLGEGRKRNTAHLRGAADHNQELQAVEGPPLYHASLREGLLLTTHIPN